MQAGKLRHRITIEAGQKRRNSYGAAQNTYAGAYEIWASIRPLGVVERQEAAKMTGNATHMLTIRADAADVPPGHRIKHKRNGATRTFEVVGQMNWDEMDKQKNVLCKETT